MNCKDVWVLWCKSKVHLGCHVVMDGSEYLYSLCFVPTDSLEEALELAKASLGEDNLELVGLSKCIRFNLGTWNWDDDEEGSIIAKSEKALEEKRVVHSTFISQEIMEDDGIDW